MGISPPLVGLIGGDHIFRRPDRLHASPMDPRRALAKAAHLVQVVRAKQHRGPALAQAQDAIQALLLEM